MKSIGDLNLWAIGYDDPKRAQEVRAELLRVEDLHGLHVHDAIVVTRLQDGSFTLQRDEPPSTSKGVLGFGVLGFIIGMVVLEPLAGAAIGTALGSLIVTSANQLGVGDDFLNEVKQLMKPGTSALFALTTTTNVEAVAHRIRGLGGTVLKTNVDPELAELVQKSLSSSPTP